MSSPAPSNAENDATTSDAVPVDTSDYTIERVMIGDGSDGLTKGLMYGSSVLFGDRTTFWELDPKSIQLSFSKVDVRFFTAKSIHKRRSLNVTHIKVQSRALRKVDPNKLTLETIVKFMKKNPGFFVKIGGPKKRIVTGSTKMFVTEAFGKNPIVSNDGGCMDAALINAVAALRDNNDWKDAKEKLEKVAYTYSNLKQCSRTLQQLKLKIQMNNISSDLKHSFKENGFKMFNDVEGGVFIARLMQVNVVDHVVCVDANRKLILDSAEEYPLKLSAEALKLCAGDNCSNPRMVEVVEIVDLSKK